MSVLASDDRARRQLLIMNTWSVPPMESANDMKAHERTYGSFVGLLKWSVPSLFVITLFLIFIIS